MSIAIVVPVRNGESIIGGCIAACLSQTRPPDELIVVDNGSTDNTASVAAAAGANVLSEPRRGSYRARNTGWWSTRADIIAFTDADCVPDPRWLEELLEPFGDLSVAGVGGPIVQAELKSATQRWIIERRFLDQEFNASGSFLPFFATANAAYRRSVLEELNGFDPAYMSGGDNDFSWRVQALTTGTLRYCPTASVRHLVGEKLSALTSRSRRYAAGDILLERRWSNWPGYPETPGFLTRTKRVWQLPLAVGYRAMTRRPMSVPLIDAAMAISGERGRWRGRIDARGSTITPLRADGANYRIPAGHR
jgi:cellulose synthase/poly-beta-1,6-N-acetylglucosamine synthase-like glycosyltransferase